MHVPFRSVILVLPRLSHFPLIPVDVDRDLIGSFVLIEVIDRGIIRFQTYCARLEDSFSASADRDTVLPRGLFSPDSFDAGK